MYPHGPKTRSYLIQLQREYELGRATFVIAVIAVRLLVSEVRFFGPRQVAHDRAAGLCYPKAGSASGFPPIDLRCRS